MNDDTKQKITLLLEELVRACHQLSQTTQETK